MYPPHTLLKSMVTILNLYELSLLFSETLRSINGVLFPGGDCYRGLIHPYYKACWQILKIVKKVPKII